MANIPYVDDRFIFNIDAGKVLFQGKEIPPTKEVIERSREQLEASQKLNRWVLLPNDDINKIRILYPMLDSSLFYDLLSNYDKNIFAEALLDMSQDQENFLDENIVYFKKMSDYIRKNIQNPEEFINKEMDYELDNLANEFFQFNHSLFLLENENDMKTL